MMLSTIANRLWGKNARLSYLFTAAVILLFSFLGGKEIWTQEHRWADIVTAMFYNHDFYHPYLDGQPYYDKPLLSYWLMAVFAKIQGELSAWSLRLPSALSGLLALYSIFRLGLIVKSRRVGLIAAWMLLTTFYFVFWARVSSADMLNLAGSLFAVAWFMDHKDKVSIKNYSIFFLIVALTCLCKGLIGAIIPVIAVMVSLSLEKTWCKHINLKLFISLVPALILYVTPFILSNIYGGNQYGENGLYMVYRENILRYFQPFDHKDPIYTYFIYLPLYTLPWVIFFIPSIFSVISRWKQLSKPVKWLALTTLFIFMFFTLSGSRRSYYILPIVPFAILMAAEWAGFYADHSLKRERAAAAITCFMLVFLFLVVDILPHWFYGKYGVERFASLLIEKASKQKPWSDWKVVMLDSETKVTFYLKLPPTALRYEIIGSRESQNRATLQAAWPFLKKPADNTIYLTRKQYEPFLKIHFKDYDLVELPAYPPKAWFEGVVKNSPVAYVPKQK